MFKQNILGLAFWHSLMNHGADAKAYNAKENEQCKRFKYRSDYPHTHILRLNQAKVDFITVPIMAEEIYYTPF